MKANSPSNSERPSSAWWPFSIAELEVVLAVLGFVVTGMSLAGLRGEVIAVCATMALAWTYIAALFVRARGAGARFEFVEDGGLHGRGYVESVRRARTSLLLQHVDDDAPSDELLALYREALERGVALRRLVFLRHDARPESLCWIADFGNHPNLEHRVVLPSQAVVTRSSFVVVDEREVVISIPGVSAVDGDAYRSTILLRHVIRIADPETATAFARIHEAIWRTATAVPSVKAFADVSGLVRELGQRENKEGHGRSIVRTR